MKDNEKVPRIKCKKMMKEMRIGGYIYEIISGPLIFLKKNFELLDGHYLRQLVPLASKYHN